MKNKSDALLSLLDPPVPLVYEKILPIGEKFQMSKSKLSRECAVCERPFSVFTWKINNNVPCKTYICQICAKTAHVCQASLLDLTLGIPVIVRNRLLKITPVNESQKEKIWFNNRMIDSKIESGKDWIDTTLQERINSIDPFLVEKARLLVENDKFLSYKVPNICPDWLDDHCMYGESCLYAHELPKDVTFHPLCTKYGIRQRFLGTDDPNGQLIVENLINLYPDFFSKKDINTNKVTDDNQETTNISSSNSSRTELLTFPQNYQKIYTSKSPCDYPNAKIPQGIAFKNSSFYLK